MLRKFVFIFLSCFLLISFAFAQTESADLQSSDSAAVSESTPEKTPQKITAIEIKGNKFVSSNTIFSKIKSKVGSLYQENVVNDDLKRLYLLGFFSDVKIDTEPSEGGVKIIIVLVERPVIESISFTGIRYLNQRDEKLKEQLKSKQAQYLDYSNLEEDIQIFKKMYEKIGFNQAIITYKVTPSKDNKVKVEFNIVENNRVRVKEIYVIGNKAFSAKRILGLVKTKKAWFFNPGVLKEETFKEDKERIKSFYQKNGYADVAVESEVKTDPDPKRPFLYITFKIKEGMRYLVGTVSIEGCKDISEKAVLARIQETAPDKVFSQDAMRSDVANIQGLYFDKGYISVSIQENAVADPKIPGRVNVSYRITENDITYVNKIRVSGNVKTRDIVVRRELRIKPGDRFDGEKLRRSKERLMNLGFFEEVSYDTKDTDSSNKKDLVVDIKEAKTGSFSFGGGYSTVDQLVGFVEIEQKNFDWRSWPYFTGAGQDLKFRASFGQVSNGFDLSFTEPWMFDYPISFGFDAYQRSHSKDTDLGYGYSEKVTGGDLRLGKEFSDYVRGNMAYRYENIKISDVDSTAANDLQSESGTNKVSSMEFGLSFDDRDNVFDTHRGNLLTSSVSVAGGPFGADKNFWKFFGRASHYTPLINNSALEFRLRMGVGTHFGDTNKIPIYERFFVGGADTVRGYRERRLGPIDGPTGDPLGGESMLVGNIEYTYPLFSFVKAATFFDIGNAWEKMNKIGTSGLKKSVGFGFRLKTPIGPIKLDYGIPMDKEPGSDKRGSGRFHFNVSNSF